MPEEAKIPADTPSATQDQNDNVRPEDATATGTTTATDAAVGASAPSGGDETSAVNPLERLLQWAGSTTARGVLAQKRGRGLFDEPLPYRTEVDWNQALELAMHRRDSERDRLDRVEGKIAPIIGGTIAGLALFVDKSGSTLDYLLAALLLIPLAMLFLAFRTKDYIDTPSLDVLVETYERWPVTFVRSVVVGTADAVAKNGPIIDSKARDLNRTMAVLFGVLVLILTVRAIEAVSNERRDSVQPQPTPTATTYAGKRPGYKH